MGHGLESESAHNSLEFITEVSITAHHPELSYCVSFCAISSIDLFTNTCFRYYSTMKYKKITNIFPTIY